MQYGFVHQYGDQYTLVSSHDIKPIEGLQRLFVCPLFFTIFETTDVGRRIALHHPVDPTTGKLDLYRHCVPHRESEGGGLEDLLGKMKYDIPDHAKYLTLAGWAQDGVHITPPKAGALIDSSLVTHDDDGRLILFICFAIGPEHPQVLHNKGNSESLYTLATNETMNSNTVNTLLNGFSVATTKLDPAALKRGEFRHIYDLSKVVRVEEPKDKDVQCAPVTVEE